MENGDLENDYSKRRQKIAKKAAKGEISMFQLYFECLKFSIPAKAEFHLVPDKTRLNSKHDLNLSVFANSLNL